MILKNIIRFIALTGIQVLLLNRIDFSGYIDPYLYVMFILLLPFSTPRGVLLLLAFAAGAVIDVFSHTYGVHAAATTLMAFLRPGVIRLVSKKQEYEIAKEPSVAEMGMRWFYLYSILLVLPHHTLLFFLETFGFEDMITLAYRIMLNTIITLLIIFIMQFLFPSKS